LNRVKYRLLILFWLTKTLTHSSISGQLSLAIPSWVGAMSTSQKAVTPCGCRGVKASMVHVWVAGNTVWSPHYTRPIYERLSSDASHNKALYKSADYLLTYSEMAEAIDFKYATQIGY